MEGACVVMWLETLSGGSVPLVPATAPISFLGGTIPVLPLLPESSEFRTLPGCELIPDVELDGKGDPAELVSDGDDLLGLLKDLLFLRAVVVSKSGKIPQSLFHSVSQLLQPAPVFSPDGFDLCDLLGGEGQSLGDPGHFPPLAWRQDGGMSATFLVMGTLGRDKG